MPGLKVGDRISYRDGEGKWQTEPIIAILCPLWVYTINGVFVRFDELCPPY